MGLFGISFAFLAKYRVDIVSSISDASEDTFAIIVVFEFPPNESLSTVVNTESLNRTGSVLFLDVEFLTNVLMQCDRVESD